MASNNRPSNLPFPAVQRHDMPLFCDGCNGSVAAKTPYVMMHPKMNLCASCVQELLSLALGEKELSGAVTSKLKKDLNERISSSVAEAMETTSAKLTDEITAQVFAATNLKK